MDDHQPCRLARETTGWFLMRHPLPTALAKDAWIPSFTASRRVVKVQLYHLVISLWPISECPRTSPRETYDLTVDRSFPPSASIAPEPLQTASHQAMGRKCLPIAPMHSLSMEPGPDRIGSPGTGDCVRPDDGASAVAVSA
jgi:hypothetical protein